MTQDLIFNWDKWQIWIPSQHVATLEEMSDILHKINGEETKTWMKWDPIHWSNFKQSMSLFPLGVLSPDLAGTPLIDESVYRSYNKFIAGERKEIEMGTIFNWNGKQVTFSMHKMSPDVPYIFALNKWTGKEFKS